VLQQTDVLDDPVFLVVGVLHQEAVVLDGRRVERGKRAAVGGRIERCFGGRRAALGHGDVAKSDD